VATKTTRVHRVALSIFLALSLTASRIVAFAVDVPVRVVAGSISALGDVKLRGVPVFREGTLFNGDTVATGAHSHSEMNLANGNKIELFGNTQCFIKQNNGHLSLQILAGNLGFAASNRPIVITFTNHELLPRNGATGGVAFLGTDLVAIRVMSGTVVVHNRITGRETVISAGTTQIIDLKTNQTNIPIAQLVSTSAAPSFPSNPGQVRGPSISALTSGKWGLIIAEIGAGAFTALYFALRESDASPSKP